MKIKRFVSEQIEENLEKGKVLILYGPRRSGKTTLLKNLLKKTKLKCRFMLGDDFRDKKALSINSVDELSRLVDGVDLLVVDEAQKIKNIGLSFKIMVDNNPLVMIVASGSASFDLAQKTEVELTGRKKILKLYPLCFSELSGFFGKWETEKRLDEWILYGMYPEVVLKKKLIDKSNYLSFLVGSYLYKDVLELVDINKVSIFEDLLKLLAFQIGKEVSLSELASSLSVSFETVRKYLDLLEKSFVIFRLSGLSRNLRKEISKNDRYYFWDNGVRNVLINNFNCLDLRDDVGQLWENFLAVERMKKLAYEDNRANCYFWRTYDQREIDWVEESGGKMKGFEFKWRKDKFKIPKDFIESYKNSSVELINKQNFLDFIKIG